MPGFGAFAESTGWPNGWPPALCLDWGAWRETWEWRRGWSCRHRFDRRGRVTSLRRSQRPRVLRSLSARFRTVPADCWCCRYLDPRRPASSRRVLGAGVPIVAAEAEGSDAGIQSAPTDGAQPVVHVEFAGSRGPRRAGSVAAIWSELSRVERVGALDDFSRSAATHCSRRVFCRALRRRSVHARRWATSSSGPTCEHQRPGWRVMRVPPRGALNARGLDRA